MLFGNRVVSSFWGRLVLSSSLLLSSNLFQFSNLLLLSRRVLSSMSVYAPRSPPPPEHNFGFGCVFSSQSEIGRESRAEHGIELSTSC